MARTFFNKLYTSLSLCLTASGRSFQNQSNGLNAPFNVLRIYLYSALRLNPHSIYVRFTSFIITLERGQDTGFKLCTPIDQAVFTDWISFRPSNLTEEINPNPEYLKPLISMEQQRTKAKKDKKLFRYKCYVTNFSEGMCMIDCLMTSYHHIIVLNP